MRGTFGTDFRDAGFEPLAVARPSSPSEPQGSIKGSIKGRRKSKKDRLRGRQGQTEGAAFVDCGKLRSTEAATATAAGRASRSAGLPMNDETPECHDPRAIPDFR